MAAALQGHPHSVRVDLSLHEVEVLKRWTSILTWVGVALNAIVLFVNLADRKKREFPARLTTNFALCAFVYNVVIGFGAFVDYGQLPDVTHSPPRPAQYPTLCKVQAGLMHYLANALSAWWLVVGITLYQIICQGRDLAYLQRIEGWYHAFAWTVPAVLTVIPAAADQLGPVQGIAWCQVKASGYSMWLFMCIYMWMALYLVVGFVLGSRTMRKLASFQRSLMTPRTAVKQYWYIIKRQAVSLVLFFAVFVAVISWGVVYAACQVTDTLVPFWVCAVAMVAVTSPSLDCFLMFGLTRSTWRYLRRCATVTLGGTAGQSLLESGPAGRSSAAHPASHVPGKRVGSPLVYPDNSVHGDEDSESDMEPAGGSDVYHSFDDFDDGRASDPEW